MKYMSRPKSAAVKDIDIDIADILDRKYLQGGPAKVKPLTFLLVTLLHLNAYVKFNDFWHM